MSQDDRKIAESIRSGQYFREARAWYQAMYIGPISERSFFMVIAILAVLTGAISVLAVTSILPLTTRPGIPVFAPEKGEDVLQSLERLRLDGESSDQAMVEFYVKKYVELREGYRPETYQSNALFIRAHSAPEVYGTYSTEYSVNNPTSPAATLGVVGARQVRLKTISVSSISGSGRAKVEFSTETVGVEPDVKARWIATFDYMYTGMKIDMVKDEKTGKDTMQVTEPEFQVTSYELEQDD